MVNGRAIGRERFGTSNFYSREFEWWENTLVLNKSQMHIQTLTGFATYIFTCAHISHSLFPNSNSLEYTFLNLNYESIKQ